MRTLIQRVQRANVRIEDQVVAEIGQGLLVLACAEPGDTEDIMERMLQKILKMRIFSDEQGKMNLSLQDVAGGLLLVSQFTLAADVSRGNRPGFSAAAAPEVARTQFDWLVERAKALHTNVQAGVFGADMKVELVNDGPVTIPMHMPAV